MRPFRGTVPMVMAFALAALCVSPAGSQQAAPENFFPEENFVQINPTLPDSKLDFNDDSKESCCAKDYTPAGQPISGITSGKTLADTNPAGTKNPAKAEFEKSNPRYVENSTPQFLITCERYAELPELVSNAAAPQEPGVRSKRDTLPITSYSTNVSLRNGATYYTNPDMRNTSDFHIEMAGGNALVKLQDVNSYSVCMARGNNTAMIANTDNASIISYNGNDRIRLAGANTNMLTRTGAGEDVIELHQAQENGANWSSYRIYKTALSGGSGTDALVIQGTPVGTKWCHIGGYRIYGEYFYVVEFALPPTVTEGPRRQRVNIGASVEYVVFKGRRYALKEFLVHGQPADAVARAIPIGDPLR